MSRAQIAHQGNLGAEVHFPSTKAQASQQQQQSAVGDSTRRANAKELCANSRRQTPSGPPAEPSSVQAPDIVSLCTPSYPDPACGPPAFWSHERASAAHRRQIRRAIIQARTGAKQASTGRQRRPRFKSLSRRQDGVRTATAGLQRPTCHNAPEQASKVQVQISCRRLVDKAINWVLNCIEGCITDEP